MELKKYHNIENISKNIVYLKYATFDPTDEEFDEYIFDLHTIYNNIESFVIIIDSSGAKCLPARLRIKQGVWLKENEELVKKKCFAQIFVIPNAIAKMVMDGVFLVQRPVVEYFVLKNKDEAIIKAKELVESFK